MRWHYRRGQEEQLSLIVSAIVLHNTIYTQRALDHVVAASLQVDAVRRPAQPMVRAAVVPTLGPMTRTRALGLLSLCLQVAERGRS